MFTTTDQDRYIFRIIFFHPDDIHNGSLLYEMLQEKLQKAGIAIPVPVKTDDGEYVVDASEEYTSRDAGYSIHTFVEGEKIDREEGFNDEFLVSMSRVMGKLHDALYQINIRDFDFRGRRAEQFQAFVEENKIGIGTSTVLTEVIPDTAIVQEMYKFWLSWAEELSIDQFTRGIIHGDIGHGANIMVKDNRVSAIIDMIGIDQGLYMEDVAKFVTYGGLQNPERQKSFNLFRDNYLIHAPLSADEFDLLPFF